MLAVTRYNSRSLANLVAQLQGWIEQSEETLSNEEGKDYPSEDRIETLNARIDSLTEAVDALEGIDS